MILSPYANGSAVRPSVSRDPFLLVLYKYLLGLKF